MSLEKEVKEELKIREELFHKLISLVDQYEHVLSKKTLMTVCTTFSLQTAISISEDPEDGIMDLGRIFDQQEYLSLKYYKDGKEKQA